MKERTGEFHALVKILYTRLERIILLTKGSRKIAKTPLDLGRRFVRVVL